MQSRAGRSPREGADVPRLSYSPRRVNKLFACLLLLVGCTGERVESVTDAGPDDTGAPGDASDAGCTTVAGNLVQNPSFEIAPGGTLSGWKADSKGSVLQQKGGAAHCDAWAEVSLPPASTSTPAYFGQDIVLDSPAPKGTKVVATMVLRTLDAELGGTLEVGILSGPDSNQRVTLQADGSWKQYSLEWSLPESASAIWVAFASESEAARRVGVDHVTLVLTPP